VVGTNCETGEGTWKCKGVPVRRSYAWNFRTRERTSLPRRGVGAPITCLVDSYSTQHILQAATQDEYHSHVPIIALPTLTASIISPFHLSICALRQLATFIDTESTVLMFPNPNFPVHNAQAGSQPHGLSTFEGGAGNALLTKSGVEEAQ
jgi:hypothetical protein